MRWNVRPGIRSPRVLLLSSCLLLACATSAERSRSTPAPVPDRPRDVTVAEAGVTAADLSALRSRALMVPVSGIRPDQVRDNYNAPRGSRIHGAIDILAPRGTPVVSADDGRIFRLRSNAAGGTTIYAVDREERFVYYYAHLDGYRRGLREGMEVAKGDVIGYVGTTGNAPPDVPHLHFQVMKLGAGRQWWNGEPINPHPFFTLAGRAR